MLHSKTKHIEIDIHFVKDKVEKKEVEIVFVCSNDQITDILTKSLTYLKFGLFRGKLKVFSKDLSLRRGVEINEETEHNSTHIEVPTKVLMNTSLAAHLGMMMETTCDNLEYSSCKIVMQSFPCH